ncbi:MAG: hypothetical protein JNJ85_09960, partial [Candidatus Kapabacteria bacterium]|nr:hypothetical protein [Candidatus Kapabacteria bacterium]
LWGDAVNTANRMESHGEPGKIHVSSDFVHALLPSAQSNNNRIQIEDIEIIPRGDIEVKGKGVMYTYFIQRPDGNG